MNVFRDILFYYIGCWLDQSVVLLIGCGMWVYNKMACKIVQDYVITPQKLGEGCFGTVYRGYVKDRKNELLAVKAIPLQSIRNEEVIKREIQILLKLKSPNIVKFYRPAKTAKHLYFFMEYCEQDLRSYFRSKGKLSEAQVLEMLRQICNGFRVVHGNNVIHRDIKPANFLIHEGVVKICDFGFARVVDDLVEPVFLTFLGSPLYMAPQLLAKEKFSSKCDIWSLGITIYELLYSRTPYTAKNPTELLANIRKLPLVFPDQPKRSEEAKQLLRAMLEVQEKDRISWPEMFQHPFIFPKPKQITPAHDGLELSFAKNEQHLLDHKVMTQITANIVESQNQSTEVRLKEIKNKSVQDIDLEIREQTEQIARCAQMEQIDKMMRYRRNVSVFLNVQCNQFFTAAQGKLDLTLFHQCLYILLLKQISILQSVSDELQREEPSAKVELGLWNAYRKSAAHGKITRFVKNDLRHLQDYFAQVSLRINKDPELATTLQHKCQDNAAYRAFLLHIFATLKPEKYFRLKLFITVDPFKYLHPLSDFGLIYEQQIQELDKIVQLHPELTQCL